MLTVEVPSSASDVMKRALQGNPNKSNRSAEREMRCAGNGSLRVAVLNGWAASVNAWDLCGFMKKPVFPVGSPSLYSYVDQLDGKPESDFREGGRFILVGWSMGGSSALRLACRFPEQIAGLVLVAATPRMMEDRDTCWKGMTPRRLEALRKGLEITRGEGFFGIPAGKPNPYMTDTPENLERGLKYLLETDVRDEVTSVFGGGCPFPVHLFHSEHDGIVRSSNARWLKEVFRGAEQTIVDGGEHALPVFIPDLLDEAVTSILADVFPGSTEIAGQGKRRFSLHESAVLSPAPKKRKRKT